MQHKELKKGLASLKLNILIMVEENEESKQPCAVKALTLTLACVKINFLIDFINDNFKTENDEE